MNETNAPTVESVQLLSVCSVAAPSPITVHQHQHYCNVYSGDAAVLVLKLGRGSFILHPSFTFDGVYVITVNLGRVRHYRFTVDDNGRCRLVFSVHHVFWFYSIDAMIGFVVSAE